MSSTHPFRCRSCKVPAVHARHRARSLAQTVLGKHVLSEQNETRRLLLCLHSRDPRPPALSLNLFWGMGFTKLCHIFRRHCISQVR